MGTRTRTDWPYDAKRDDPLAKLRIPVASAYPEWRYILVFDRESEKRPTDLEAQQLASFIEQYKRYFFNDWYIGKLEERPFDCDAVTKVFHKWGDDDWSYRVVTWERGPFWVPVAPRLRGGEYDYPQVTGPMNLLAVMDRTHGVGAEYPSNHWLEWKAAHPEVFGD